MKLRMIASAQLIAFAGVSLHAQSIQAPMRAVYDKPAYDGGHHNTPETARKALQGMRNRLQGWMNDFDNSKYFTTGNWRDARK